MAVEDKPGHEIPVVPSPHCLPSPRGATSSFCASSQGSPWAWRSTESSLGITEIGMSCRELLGVGDLCSGQQTTARGPPSFLVHLPGLSLLFFLFEGLLCPQEEDACFHSSTEVGSRPRLSRSEPLAGSTLFIHCSVLQHPCLQLYLPQTQSPSAPPSLLWMWVPPGPFPYLCCRVSLSSNLIKWRKNKKPLHVGFLGSHWLYLLEDCSFLAFQHLFINHVSLSLSFLRFFFFPSIH